MWAYFSSLKNSTSLVCKKVITHGIPARVGNAGSFSIFCYVDGITPFQNATLSLKDPMGKVVSNEGILGQFETKTFEFLIGENAQNVYPFENNKNYNGFTFLFETSSILYIGGKWTANVTFYTPTKNYVTQTFSFDVEQSSLRINNYVDISLSQYQELIKLISSYGEEINNLRLPKTFTIVNDLITNVNGLKFGGSIDYKFNKSGSIYIFSKENEYVYDYGTMQQYLKFMTGFGDILSQTIQGDATLGVPNHIYLISKNENKVYRINYVNPLLVAYEIADFPFVFKKEFNDNIDDLQEINSQLIEVIRALQGKQAEIVELLSKVEQSSSTNTTIIQQIQQSSIIFENEEFVIPEEDR